MKTTSPEHDLLIQRLNLKLAVNLAHSLQPQGKGAIKIHRTHQQVHHQPGPSPLLRVCSATSQGHALHVRHNGRKPRTTSYRQPYPDQANSPPSIHSQNTTLHDTMAPRRRLPHRTRLPRLSSQCQIPSANGPWTCIGHNLPSSHQDITANARSSMTTQNLEFTPKNFRLYTSHPLQYTSCIQYQQ